MGMKSIWMGLALVAIACATPVQSFDTAWAKVQSGRAEQRKIWSEPKASREQLKSAATELERLKQFCLTPEAKQYKNAAGQPIVFFQRNDILVELIAIYAKLGDRGAVHAALRELSGSINGPETPITDETRGTYSFYANWISGYPEVQSLRPDPEIDSILADFRKRDPDRIYKSLPYLSGDTDKISASDRVAGLTMIWSEAKYNFANFDLVADLDWDAAYQKFLPRVMKNQSRYAYYRELREFVGLLKDSHTDIGLPPSIRARDEARPELPIWKLGDQVVVWREPSVDFQKLGFRKGDVIERVDGVPTLEYGAKKWGTQVSCSTPQDRDMRVYTYMLLRGPQKKPVTLSIERADGTRAVISVPRDKPLAGVEIPPYEFKVLPDGTAYFAFNTCANEEPAEGFKKVFPEIMKAGRLIIDARLNDGGNSGVGWDMIQRLISKPIEVGHWETRTYRPSFRAWGRRSEPYRGSQTLGPYPETFAGPVAVLSSNRTFSAGEDFLSAFRASGRGKIFGMPSGGSTGQPLSFQLPGGGWARICTKRDRMADGTDFVGVGVIPDVRVETTAADIRANRDVVFEAALRQVNAVK